MRHHIALAAGLVLLAAPLAAGQATIAIIDPHARSSGATAQSGAAFMTIENRGDADDRLIGASSDIAARVELHTHEEDDDGVMRMSEVEDGFAIPAGGSYSLERGGAHVMLMGIDAPFEDGETIALSLEFEHAGPVEVEVPVDLSRGQSGHDHD